MSFLRTRHIRHRQTGRGAAEPRKRRTSVAKYKTRERGKPRCAYCVAGSRLSPHAVKSPTCLAAGFFLGGVAGLGGVVMPWLPGCMRRLSKSSCCFESEMGGRETEACFSLLDIFLGAPAPAAAAEGASISPKSGGGGSGSTKPEAAH